MRDWTIELDDYVSGLAWSPDGTMLAASTSSGLVAVFDGEGGAERQYFRAHTAPVMQLVWSPANAMSTVGAVLASSAQDGTAKLWNPTSLIPDKQDGDLLATLECGANKSAWVDGLAWSPDGTVLATSSGKIVRLWKTDGTRLQSYEGFQRTVTALAWHPQRTSTSAEAGTENAAELAVASFGGVKFFQPSDAAPKAELALPSPILTLLYSPDATVLVAGLQENAVHFWRAPFHEETASAMRGYPEKISHLAFNALSTHLATPSSRGVIVWSFLGGGPEGTAPTVIEGHFARVTQVQFQHAGQLLASSDESGLVLVSSPLASARPLKAEMYQQEISHLAWSPDDRRLAVGTAEGIVDVWEVNV
jgi:WD40 repeat protein